MRHPLIHLKHIVIWESHFIIKKKQENDMHEEILYKAGAIIVTTQETMCLHPDESGLKQTTSSKLFNLIYKFFVIIMAMKQGKIVLTDLFECTLIIYTTKLNHKELYIERFEIRINSTWKV